MSQVEMLEQTVKQLSPRNWPLLAPGLSNLMQPNGIVR